MTTLQAPLDETDSVALLARQTEILEQIATGVPLTTVLAGIAATLEELVPGCRCSVLLLDRHRGVLRHGAAPSLPSAYCDAIDGLPIGRRAGSCGTAAFTGDVVVASDIRRDVRWAAFRELAARADVRACWSTPIRGRDGVCGTFAVYHRHPHRPSAREEHLVERLTHLTSVAIDHDAVTGALAESEERFRRAFEDNAVGMALATLAGVVTRVNDAMAQMLGRDGRELVGARLDSLFRRRHPAGEVPATYEATATAADGRHLDVAVTVSHVRDATDTARSLSVNVLDVTERRAAERERRARVEAELARTAAETANRAKTDFVAALGHELRTPLQAITGFTEVLGTLDLDATRRAEALRHIAAAAGHILSMVGDVLDVARIEARALPLAVDDVVLADVVAEVFAMAEPLADAERVRLVRGSGEGAVARADERRVTQVLLNLVTNAVRYNRAGGAVTVDCADDGSTVRVSVHDTGPGIAAEHLDRLFTPFDRLGRDCDAGVADGGVGLGLPLARGLTEAMDGTLVVDSTPGEGTTVTVRLPRVPRAAGP